jgi:hypothetical protein
LLGKAEERKFSVDLDEIGIQSRDLSLDDPSTEDEIWATIRDLSIDKAPGPNGFTG